jgi:alkanesulfonate monooxygenase SsuD/methylene tetrahydromethanopterin reductase-like flavin-dependent oxidoreductase (luciferase family)
VKLSITMVSWASIRPPAVLVKAVTTLDVLAGGRSWLGVVGNAVAQMASPG